MPDKGPTCWAAVKHRMPDGSIMELRCKNAPMRGQTICQFHGGKAPHLIAKGEEQIVVQEVTKTLGKFGVPVVADPKEVLLHAIAVAHGNAILLEQMLQDVDAEDVASDDPQTRARARGVLNLHAEWQDRAAALSAQAIRVGIEERLVRAQEWQAGIFLKVVQNAAGRLEPGVREAFMQDVGNQLRLLAAGDVG